MPEQNSESVRGYQFGDMGFRAYAIEPRSWNEENRSVAAILATENPVIVMDMRARRPIQEVLRMDGLVMPSGNRLPLQDSHNRGSVRHTLGSTVNLRVEAGQFVGDNVISSVEDRVATKVREGHITDNSIGYIVLDREVIEPGEEREVLGVSYRAGSLPLQVSTRWAPKENSLTPIGADEAAKMRSFQFVTEEDMAEEKPVETPPEEVAEERAEPEAPAEDPVEEPAVDRRALLEDITPRGYEDVLEDAIIKGLDVDSYRSALLEEKAKRAAPVGTPEPPAERKKDGLEDVTDAEFLRAF